MEWRLRSEECGMSSVGCQGWGVKCGVGSVECELWCVERGVRCKMESGKGAE